MTQTNRIDVRDLVFKYDDRKIIDRISFQSSSGKVLAFVGPSGCGKTTLLRCLAGLLPLQSGVVSVGEGGGQLLGACSFVFQSPTLLPWLKVVENLSLPFKLRGLEVPRDKIKHQLDILGLAGFEHHFQSQLSLGMAQRVAFARALSDPRKLLLLDEPFSGLDDLTKRTLALSLSRAIHEQDLTAILVTHSIHDAVFLADHIFVLSDRPARVVSKLNIPFGHPREKKLWLSGNLISYMEQVRSALERKPDEQ